MKNLAPLLLLGLGLFTGCASHYVITMSNGTQVGTQGKPELKGGSYYFKDANGKETSVSAGRVSQIETDSSAARGHKAGFIDSGKK